MKGRPKNLGLVCLAWLSLSVAIAAEVPDDKGPSQQEAVLEAMHAISSHDLFGYVKELCSEKYGGRLTGTEGYNLSADWVVNLLKEWKVEPAGDNADLSGQHEPILSRFDGGAPSKHGNARNFDVNGSKAVGKKGRGLLLGRCPLSGPE